MIHWISVWMSDQWILDKHRDDVNTAEDWIKVNDIKAVCNRLSNPHSCIFIRRISNTAIPIKSLWVLDVIMSEQKKKRQTWLTSKPHIPSISWSEQDGPFCHDSNAQIWSWYMLLIPFSSLRWDHRFTDWQLCNKGVDGRKFMWSMLVVVGDSLVTEQLVNKCIQRAEIMLIHQWSLPNHWCHDMYRHVKTA